MKELHSTVGAISCLQYIEINGVETLFLIEMLFDLAKQTKIPAFEINLSVRIPRRDCEDIFHANATLISEGSILQN